MTSKTNRDEAIYIQDKLNNTSDVASCRQRKIQTKSPMDLRYAPFLGALLPGIQLPR